MYIKVHVIAGAKKETFKKVAPDSFEIAVREKAERNMANRRVIELVRLHSAGGAGEVRIVAGHRSPKKILSIESDARA